ILLVCALVMIKKRNIPAHRNFMLSAFGVTLLFFVSYLTYHAMAGSTSFGGDGIVKYIYYAFLISHILLAAILVPLSLLILGHVLNRNVRKHWKIARWSMPIWLYVSLSGVLVYVFISPYYLWEKLKPPVSNETGGFLDLILFCYFDLSKCPFRYMVESVCDEWINTWFLDREFHDNRTGNRNHRCL